MIYRLETGVDREINKNLITVVIILAVTVALPALAALVNQVSPFTSSIDPGDVMGTNTDNAKETDNEPEGKPSTTADETADTGTTDMPMPSDQTGLQVAGVFQDSTGGHASTATTPDQAATDHSPARGSGSSASTAPSKNSNAGSGSPLPVGGEAPSCSCSSDSEDEPTTQGLTDPPAPSAPSGTNSGSPPQSKQPDDNVSLDVGLGELLEVEADLKPANKDGSNLELNAELLNTPVIY